MNTMNASGTCCAPSPAKDHVESILRQYKPLIVIIVLLLNVTFSLAVVDYFQFGLFFIDEIMMNFMAGFFLVFAGLKLMDISGFARSYAMYDLLASKVRLYGYVYPFLELALGLAYLTRLATVQTNILTVLLMTFSALGVGVSIFRKQKFHCACLGTLLKVPLTKVAFIEDVSMASMAALMLL